MPLRLISITVDCDDVTVVSSFWSAALGREIDPGSSARFASIGGGDPERAAECWYFEKVPEHKVAKNRMHVDLVDPDPDRIDRLVTLGASIVAVHEITGGTHQWTVMQDPEGNEFCVTAKPFTG